MYSQYFTYEPGKEKDKKEIIFKAAVNGVTEWFWPLPPPPYTLTPRNRPLLTLV